MTHSNTRVPALGGPISAGAPSGARRAGSGRCNGLFGFDSSIEHAATLAGQDGALVRMQSQSATDRANSEFWKTLCGTTDAIRLGIADRSPASLKKFDDWYFEFYPYLERHIPFEAMKGADVLEVGLGYGTVGQRIAESSARYTGFDIAHGPVEMMNYRLSLLGAPETAVEGSILE